MRFFEEFHQPQPRFRKNSAKFAGLVSCDSGPTRNEKERARVLEISREKIKGSDESKQNKSKKNRNCDETFIATDGDSTQPK